MRRLCLLIVFSLLFLVCIAGATIFGAVRGVVHDPQHRPVTDASVKLKSATSDWSQTAVTDRDGAFSFTAVPVGDYLLTVRFNRNGAGHLFDHRFKVPPPTGDADGAVDLGTLKLEKP